MKDGARREDPAETPVGIERPPPLAVMAGVAAVVDLFWNRVAVRLIADDDTAIALMRAGVFPRNLAAVAAFAALALGLFGFLRMAGYAGLMRRLVLSSVSGLLLPAFLLAMIIPKERVNIFVVLIALGMTNALSVLVGVGAAPYRSGVLRWSVVSATTSAALVLAVLVIASQVVDPAIGTPIGIVARYTGEIAWHAVLLCSAWFVVRPGRPGMPASLDRRPSRAVLVAAAVSAVFVAALGLYGQQLLHSHRFSTLVYGALRLNLGPDGIFGLYAVSVGIAIGGVIAGLASGSGPRAQVGAAIALWLAAGYAPRAPGQLLYFALAVVLLARAAQAMDPDGRHRARLRWGPLFPATEPSANESTSDERPPS